jgi:hypothetical protein
MYATGGKSEIPGRFFSVVLEKDGDQWDPTKKKKKYYIESRRREISTCNEKEEG